MITQKQINMDLISKTLHHIGQNYQNTSVIQIGAMDGINFDDTRGFLDMYGWKSLLVEPIPDIFNELKENFKDRENYTFEQSAITEDDGTVKMLTVPNEIIKEMDLHPGYKGMSALYPLKNGFGSDYQRDIDVKEQFGVTIEVPSLTLNSLLKKHNIDYFDIFLCDAEGYDWNIFKQLDLTKYRPKFIRLEYINLTEDEKSLLMTKFLDNDYFVDVNGQDIDAVDVQLYNEICNLETKEVKIIEFDETSEENKKIIYLKEENSYLRDEIKSIKELLTKMNINNIPNFETNRNLTIVTGLWNIGRPGRDFSHYIEHFRNFLDIPQNLFIYIPAEYEYLVWEKRSKKNTYVKIYELEDVKNLYNPFWNKTQEIRVNPNWLNQAGWLSGSPQAVLEYYNPIVQSKMFMLNDASIWNPFNTEYFFWLDAGITNTVPHSHFVENNVLDKLTEIGNPFLFLSYPYEADTEIHGFTFSEMNKIARTKVEYVCRGGLFGGHKQQINEANATYYSLLTNTLNTGYMGTEESIFTLMSYLEPHIYKRFELDGNGLIVKFTQAVIDNKIEIVAPKITQLQNLIKYTDRDVEKVKTNLYVLTFNFPEQVLHTIESMKKTPEWLTKPHLVLLDNSTTEEVRNENRKIAQDYNFEYISLEGNTGICGGRQAAAEHFHNSDADFMFFFEDDMTSNPPEYEGQFCRNGFRKYIPNLYNLYIE